MTPDIALSFERTATVWDTFTWRDLRTTEINAEIDELRTRTVQLLIGVAIVGYVTWHLTTLTVYSTYRSQPDVFRNWLYFPIALTCLGASYAVQRRGWRWMTEFFLISSLVAVTASIWILHSAVPTILYPLLTLAAVVLLQPLAGLAIGATSIGLLATLWWAGPFSFLDLDRLVVTGVACLLTVAVAWALGRNLVIAVKWSLDSYAQALRSAQEAQSHRAELYQALKQLDNAYYRLERANAALELAWRAAEVAERSKSEFVTNISHELRTPLNLIIGFSEMILTSPESYGEPLPAAYRGDLNAIYRSAQHLLTLTEDVLDLTRVGIGRLSLAREPIDLAQVIRDACDIVGEYISAKRLRLRFEVQADLPILTVDRLRIRQVLLNLLTNAARFTQDGGITVSASLEARHVVVKVTDTGQGIAPADLARVFDEFYHVDTKDSSQQHGLGGIGLGLPLSKRLIELHGGQMGVESTLGVGTTFWFTLPVITEDRTVEGDRWRPLRIPGLPGTGERILVLTGDDGRLAQFLEHHLRGYRVITAPDVARATEMALEIRAVAILADASVDVADSVQETPVPVIRLPFPHIGRMAAAYGVAAYLVKPITRAELREAVERLGRPIRSVLIVDDDPRFVRLITRYIRWIGQKDLHQVMNAHSGQEALRLLEGFRPDLILLDLAMEDLSGDEVLAAMLEDPQLAGIPVIIITAHVPGEAQLTLVGPVSLLKPEGFRLEELLGVTEALLGALQPPRQYLTAGVEALSRSGSRS